MRAGLGSVGRTRVVRSLLGMNALRVIILLVATSVMLALGACGSPVSRHRASPGAPLSERLASADLENGQRVFRQCAACHNLTEGGGDRDGPNLWDIIGKPVATNSDRFGYTGALKAFGGVWTCERLDLWLTNPARTVPGTIMGFAGLSDGADRADVIAYLSSQGRRRSCAATAG